VWSFTPIRRAALFFSLLLAVLLGTAVVWPTPKVTLAQSYNWRSRSPFAGFPNLIPAYLHTVPAEAIRQNEAETDGEAKRAEETGKSERTRRMEAESSAAEPEKAAVTAPPRHKARAGIIIDDVGAVKETMDEFLKIDAPLAWAILPFATFAGECALLGKEHGYFPKVKSLINSLWIC
jgi:hypothetical protein